MNKREKLSLLMDAVAYVMTYAPDFPYDDYLPPEKQMTPESEFADVNDKLADFVKDHGVTHEITACAQGIDDAYRSYRDGDGDSGFVKIQAVLHALMELCKRVQ